MNGEIRIAIENTTMDEILRFEEIFKALVKSGGLSGVKGGKTILHFDNEGLFQGIELDYWPWRRRKQ